MTNANKPIEGVFERTEEELRDQLDIARTRLAEIDAQIRQAVKERPLVAVGSALLLGYALGRLLARK